MRVLAGGRDGRVRVLAGGRDGRVRAWLRDHAEIVSILMHQNQCITRDYFRKQCVASQSGQSGFLDLE
jgi:hypothetical protein